MGGVGVGYRCGVHLCGGGGDGETGGDDKTLMNPHSAEEVLHTVQGLGTMEGGGEI